MNPSSKFYNPIFNETLSLSLSLFLFLSLSLVYFCQPSKFHSIDNLFCNFFPFSSRQKIERRALIEKMTTNKLQEQKNENAAMKRKQPTDQPTKAKDDGFEIVSQLHLCSGNTFKQEVNLSSRN